MRWPAVGASIPSVTRSSPSSTAGGCRGPAFDAGWKHGPTTEVGMSRVAAVDCGTNSIRLLVADLTVREDGSAWLRDVHREMRVNRLGQGVDATGRLAPESLVRTREALCAYAEMLRRHGVAVGPDTVRVCATSATRDAANREEFFGAVRE